MPASTQTPDGKLQLTGDVNLLLRNSLGNGETIKANWQQLQYQSPRLNLGFEQAYVFSNRAGIDFYFELFKKDTQFLNLQTRIGIPYEIRAGQTGKLFYQFQQNNTTTIDTAYVKQNQALPDLADISLSLLGLEWLAEQTNYRFNPRKGYQGLLQFQAGLKKIRESTAITSLEDGSNFNYAGLYDSVKLKTYQLRLKGGFSHYLPMGGNLVLKSGLQGGWLQSANYYRNELFQIGGFKMLRGFDEESIYARSYAVVTAELRYLTGRNSFLFAFLDGGYAGYKDELTQYNHRYFGTGLGLNLETKNSQVNLSWAIGKRDDLPLNFRQSKIHIGFVNFF
jgi:outer membrane protein assembly factor BamA